MEPTENLRLLFVVDEAHVLLDDSEHCRILDRAVRQLRKFGVGCVFISQFYYDFETRGVRGNAHTRIIMRTGWEKDIQNLKSLMTRDHAEVVSRLDSGYGIFKSMCMELGPMANQPYFCKFLKYNELLQPAKSLAFENVPGDDTDQRRSKIVEILGLHPHITPEDVRAELEKIGIRKSIVTIYEDLDWLENQKRVIHVVRERGRRHYVAL